MKDTSQITLPYDLDGIALIITAEITPGEPMTYDSPAFGDVIETITISGYHYYPMIGEKVEFELPEAMVDEMRESTGIDDYIYDELKRLKFEKEGMK